MYPRLCGIFSNRSKYQRTSGASAGVGSSGALGHNTQFTKTRDLPLCVRCCRSCGIHSVTSGPFENRRSRPVSLVGSMMRLTKTIHTPSTCWLAPGGRGRARHWPTHPSNTTSPRTCRPLIDASSISSSIEKHCASAQYPSYSVSCFTLSPASSIVKTF